MAALTKVTQVTCVTHPRPARIASYLYIGRMAWLFPDVPLGLSHSIAAFRPMQPRLPLREGNMGMRAVRQVLHCFRTGLGPGSLVLAAMLTGCGGGGGTNGGGTPPPPAVTTPVQINMGDAPADWMLAVSMNITSMSMVRSDGSTSVISTPTTMEMVRLTGTMQPVAMVNLPQGTYTGANLAVSSVNLSYMDPYTFLPVQAAISSPFSAHVNFSTPITVGTTPMAIGFDLNLAKSLVLNTDSTFSMTPVFHVTTGLQGSGNAADPMNGGIQEMMGVVSGVTSSGFTLSSMQAAQNFNFTMNSSTVFNGTTMSSLSNGMGLLVDATLQPDGTLLATRVQAMAGSGGSMGAGIITGISGISPPTLTIAMQNGAGNGVMSSMLTNGITVTMSGATFVIDDGIVDLSNLPFAPVFDANDVYAGQNVMPISSSAMMSSSMGGGMGGSIMLAGSMTATGLRLEPQGVSGTISSTIIGGTPSSFTLTLPSVCALSALTGATTITVYQQQSTVVLNETNTPPTSNIGAGSTVQVFGLLFNNGGQWVMVAARITAS